MTTYTVTAGNLAAHGKTLAANTEDVVAFADNISEVTVTVTAVASGAAPIYFTTDGTAATVAGAKCNVFVPAAAGDAFTVELSGGTDEIHLISAGAHTYSAERN